VDEAAEDKTMHDRPTVALVLSLRHEGLGARRIAKRTNLPLSTVRDWLAGEVPAHSQDPTGLLLPACAVCGHDEHRFSELNETYVYLLGLYLGDGSIACHPRNVYKLRITLDTRYPGIIGCTAIAMREVRQGHVWVQRRRGHNCVDVSSYWKAWPCFFPQHGPGKKLDRHIELADWQRRLVDRSPEHLLRGLIHSDGHRFINTGRGNWRWPRYGFDQVSEDIRGIFCDACDRMGLHWTRAGKHTIYVSRKADVARLDTFIGPKR
jgi:hypothetical protein